MEGAQYVAYTAGEYDAFLLPIIAGILVSFCLFGASFVQFIDCFSRIGRESRHERFTWWYLCVLACFDLADSIGKGLVLTDYMRMVVTGGVLGSLILPRVAVMIASLDAAIATLNHVIYLYRIVRLTPGRSIVVWVLLIFTGLVSLAQLIAGCYISKWSLIPLSEWFPTGVLPWAVTWLGGSSLADVLCCGMFVWSIGRHHSDFSKTNQIILKWISLAIETGALPTAIQLSTLVLDLRFHQRPYATTLGCFQSKLYCNSILFMIRATLANKDVTATTAASYGSASYPRTPMGGRSLGPTDSFGGESHRYHSPSRPGTRKEGVATGVTVTQITTNLQYEPSVHDQLELGECFSEKSPIGPRDRYIGQAA